MGDVLYRKDDRGYCVREWNANQTWLGFAKENALKGESVTFGPKFDLVKREGGQE